MAFIGNTPQNQGFTPAIDYFNGNGVTVTFTLSRPVVSVAQMIVAIDNVIQNPSTAFTVAGNAITFTSAPLSGTNNIWVEYTSLITQYNAISQDPSVIGDITASGGYLATGDFGNTFTDGTIVDYVTGMARITTGDADGITLYNNGPSARNALMALASNGNVGIGTTSPTDTALFTRALDLNGTSGAAYYARTNGSATNYTAFGNFGSDGYINNRGAGSLVFNNNGSERMRIDNIGALLVGLTSNASLGAATGVQAFQAGYLYATVSNDACGGFARRDSNGDIVIFRRDISTVGSISYNGSLTLYNQSSDYRLKTVIAPVTNAGERIDAVEPIEYSLENGNCTKGFLAHKFAEVYPNSVNGEKDAVDAKGDPIYQSMQASSAEVMADLISEIQSLRKRVAILEAKGAA